MVATFTGWELHDPVPSVHYALHSHTQSLTVVQQSIHSVHFLHVNPRNNSKEAYKMIVWIVVSEL
jgi:hypothetical protein